MVSGRVYIVVIGIVRASRNQDFRKSRSRKWFDRASDIPEFVPDSFAVNSHPSNSCFSSRLRHSSGVIVVLVAEDQGLIAFLPHRRCFRLAFEKGRGCFIELSKDFL
jgi:hypothetical protein